MKKQTTQTKKRKVINLVINFFLIIFLSGCGLNFNEELGAGVWQGVVMKDNQGGCEDWNYEYISIQTPNKERCYEAGLHEKFLRSSHCFIPIIHNMPFNKQFCNFLEGEKVFILENEK